MFPATVANLKPALWFCGKRCKNQISAMVKQLSGLQGAKIERSKVIKRDGFLKKKKADSRRGISQQGSEANMATK